MISHHIYYYQLAILGLLWLCILLYSLWPSRGAVSPQALAEPVPPQRKRKRSNDPQAFEGLTQRPHCTACEHDANQPKPQPPRRPTPWHRPTGAPVWLTPRCTFAPMKAVTIEAVWGWATCVPMALPAAAPGVSFTVCHAAATCWKRTARSSMVSVPRLTSSCASSPAWPRAGHLRHGPGVRG